MSEQRLTYKQFLLSRKAELNKRCVNQAKDRFEFKPKSLKVKDNEEGDVYDLTNADDLWVLIKILNVYYELAESHKLVIEKYVGSDTVGLLNEQQATIDKLDQENADLLGARIKAQEQLDVYKEAILTMLGLLADKGLIFSGVKDE